MWRRHWHRCGENFTFALLTSAGRAVGGESIWDINAGRRRLLQQMLAFGAVAGGDVVGAWAQPAGRAMPPLRRQPTVVLDPGHGGVDPGAISPHGAYENHLVIAL